MRWPKRWGKTEVKKRVLTGNCPIIEHAGDGVSVGRCDFALWDNICPRHGLLEDYPNLDDRDVPYPHMRRFDR